MAQPTIGKTAPAFTLPATGNQTIRLSALKGQNVVVYFYPRDATPGCTTESQHFRDARKAFAKANTVILTVILGISQDSIKSHERFKEKQSLNFELLSDETADVCRKYDVWKLKKMYGKEFEGIERSTFLIDANGKLQAQWRKVKVPGHVEEVLAAAVELN